MGLTVQQIDKWALTQSTEKNIVAHMATGATWANERNREEIAQTRKTADAAVAYGIKRDEEIFELLQALEYCHKNLKHLQTLRCYGDAVDHAAIQVAGELLKKHGQ